MTKQKRTKAEKYAQAAEMKLAGFSLADIGVAIGCTRQYAHKLLKGGPPESPEPSTEVSTGPSTSAAEQLTLRQRRFAAGLIEGKTQQDAALGAVEPGSITPAAAGNWASQQVRNDDFREGYSEVLAAAGLSKGNLAKAHAELMQATKVVGFDRDEDGNKQTIERPDNAARNAALKLAYEVLGLTGQNQQSASAGNVVIQINAATAKVWATLRGDGSLPDGVEVVPDPIDVRPEEEPRQLEGSTKPADAEESEPPDQS